VNPSFLTLILAVGNTHHQSHEAWKTSARLLVEHASFDIYPTGTPYLMDLGCFLPWQQLVEGTYHFTLAESDVYGCCLASDAQLLTRRSWTVMDAEYPAILLVKELVSQGWNRGEVVSHTPHNAPAKRLVAKKIVERKSYLRCLLVLHELFGRGLQELPVGAHETFYRCVLAARDPSTVPLRKKVQDYTKVLEEFGDQIVCVSAPNPRVLFPELSGERPPDEAVGVDATEGGGADPDDGNGGVGGDGGADRDGDAMPPDLGVGGDADEDSDAGRPPSGQSSSDDASSGDVAPVVGGSVSMLPPGWHEGDALMSLMPAMIDGNMVRQDNYYQLATGIHYSRIGIACPMHESRGARGNKMKCFIWRNIGKDQRLGLDGVEGPVAFVTAWLRDGPNHLTRESHMRFKPAKDDVLRMASTLASASSRDVFAAL
jgi:hypothetical protein